MARNIIATEQPTAVPGLIEGLRYGIQNQSPDATMRAVTAAAEPDRGDPSAMLQPGDAGTARLKAGERLFVWTSAGRALVFIDEVP